MLVLDVLLGILVGVFTNWQLFSTGLLRQFICTRRAFALIESLKQTHFNGNPDCSIEVGFVTQP